MPQLFASENEEYVYILDISSSEFTQDNYIIELSGLPSWLNFDSDGLTLSGTPTEQDSAKIEAINILLKSNDNDMEVYDSQFVNLSVIKDEFLVQDDYYTFIETDSQLPNNQLSSDNRIRFTSNEGLPLSISLQDLRNHYNRHCPPKKSSHHIFEYYSLKFLLHCISI